MSKKRKTLHSLRKLAHYLAPYKWGFFGAITMVILTVVAITIAPTMEGMITTQLAKDAMDLLNKVEGAQVHFTRIAQIIFVLLVIYGIKTLVQGAGIYLLTNAIQDAMFDLRSKMQQKLGKLPVRYFDAEPYGDVLSKMTNDIESISNALQQTFVQIISGILSLVLALTMMFTIQPVMAWIAILIIPLSLLVSSTVVKKSQPQFKQQQDALGALNGMITEKYTGYNEIILYNKQEEAVVAFEKANEELRTHAFKAQFMSSLMSPLISLVTYLIIGSTAVIGCLMVISGGLLLGQLQAFIRYVWQIYDPLSQVSQLSTQIQSAFAAMDRVFSLLEEEEEQEVVNPLPMDGTTSGKVEFQNVSFGYNEKPIIQNLNITIEPGQMVAIVGPTGAGKTTLINLLLRFYDVTGGSIIIDGVDIRKVKRETLRDLFGMVLQDTWLFSGTIDENIGYGRLTARKDERRDAAKMANVHHFIRTLPGGYQMEIQEDGNNLSQGEKQLLTIARAILKDPKILILDEATSSVDTRLEKRLQDAMKKVMEGRTSFVIAHRLSTIRNADVILVMKDGNIIEHGNHEALMNAGGFYKNLYKAQFASEE